MRNPISFAAVAGTASGGQADIVNFRIGAPIGAARDGDFEFARKIVKLGIAAKLLIESQNERRNIEEFARIQAGKGAAGDVARHISTGTGGAQPNSLQSFKNFWQRFDANPVQLNILANSDVGNAISMFCGEGGDRADLLCCKRSHWEHEYGP